MKSYDWIGWMTKVRQKFYCFCYLSGGSSYSWRTTKMFHLDEVCHVQNRWVWFESYCICLFRPWLLQVNLRRQNKWGYTYRCHSSTVSHCERVRIKDFLDQSWRCEWSWCSHEDVCPKLLLLELLPFPALPLDQLAVRDLLVDRMVFFLQLVVIMLVQVF